MNIERGALGILALDLGSHTGFEVMSRGVFSRDLIDLTEKGRFREDGFAAFDYALDGLIRLLRKYNREIEIVAEKPHAGRFFHSTRILFGLLAVLQCKCSKKGLPLKVYSPKAIKKFWTGSGVATKEEMVAKAKQLVSRRIEDNNIADACALMRLHLKQRKEIDA